MTAPCITEARLRALRDDLASGNGFRTSRCELLALVDLGLAGLGVAKHLPDLPLYEAGPEATDAIDELLNVVP